MPRNPHDESLMQSLKEFSVLLNQHEFTRALPIARRLVAKYPDDFLAYQACSVCYLELGRHLEALRTLKKGLARFPDNYHLLYFMGETLERLQRYEEAEGTYRAAIEKTPPSDHHSLSNRLTASASFCGCSTEGTKPLRCGEKPSRKTRRTEWR